MDFQLQSSSLTVKLNNRLLAFIKRKYGMNGTILSIDHLKMKVLNFRSDLNYSLMSES